LSLIQLEKVVGESWPWFGKYGDELLEELVKMSIPPLQPKPKQARGQKRAVDEQYREEEKSAKRSRTSRTTSSKKATQNPDPSPPAAPASFTTLPATPLPHNPYAHLLTSTGSSQQPRYLGYQPQPQNYMYYYNPTPHLESDSQILSMQHQHSPTIASSSRTPQNRDLFRPYSPKKKSRTISSHINIFIEYIYIF
jgi:hypothetical protein